MEYKIKSTERPGMFVDLRWIDLKRLEADADQLPKLTNCFLPIAL